MYTVYTLQNIGSAEKKLRTKFQSNSLRNRFLLFNGSLSGYLIVMNPYITGRNYNIRFLLMDLCVENALDSRDLFMNLQVCILKNLSFVNIFLNLAFKVLLRFVLSVLLPIFHIFNFFAIKNLACLLIIFIYFHFFYFQQFPVFNMFFRLFFPFSRLQSILLLVQLCPMDHLFLFSAFFYAYFSCYQISICYVCLPSSR